MSRKSRKPKPSKNKETSRTKGASRVKGQKNTKGISRAMHNWLSLFHAPHNAPKEQKSRKKHSESYSSRTKRALNKYQQFMSENLPEARKKALRKHQFGVPQRHAMKIVSDWWQQRKDKGTKSKCRHNHQHHDEQKCNCKHAHRRNKRTKDDEDEEDEYHEDENEEWPKTARSYATTAKSSVKSRTKSMTKSKFRKDTQKKKHETDEENEFDQEEKGDTSEKSKQGKGKNRCVCGVSEGMIENEDGQPVGKMAAFRCVCGKFKKMVKGSSSRERNIDEKVTSQKKKKSRALKTKI